MAPTIFVVPGFYEGPMVFQPLANNFNERGFKTVITTISSTGKTPTDSPTMDDDIANIAKDFVPVVDEAGEEGVIAVMHSAGGFIGSGALKGLAFKARQDAGKAGGVKKIVFIAAGVAPEGFEQGPVPFFDYHSNGTQTCRDPRSLLYGDFSDEEANKWLPGLQHQADRGWATKLQYC